MAVDKEYLFICYNNEDGKWYIFAARPLGNARVSNGYHTYGEALKAMTSGDYKKDVEDGNR